MKIVTDIKALSKPCSPAGDRAETLEILAAMQETLDEHPNGCGLAANQIGFDKCIAILRHEGQETILINPIILEHSDKKVKSVEGCLSFPGKTVTVRRSESIIIQTDDFGPVEITGQLAIIAQHEIDHLNGITCVKKPKYNNGSRFTPKKKKRKKR